MSASQLSRMLIVAALLLAIAGVIALKRQHTSPDPGNQPAAQETAAPGARRLPRLLDLGADKCVACKMMVPVLADLRQSQAGRLDVDFIDVWKNPKAAEQYRIEAIPTQIFLDANGRELYRHSGFISKDDILRKFTELGVRL